MMANVMFPITKYPRAGRLSHHLLESVTHRRAVLIKIIRAISRRWVDRTGLLNAGFPWGRFPGKFTSSSFCDTPSLRLIATDGARLWSFFSIESNGEALSNEELVDVRLSVSPTRNVEKVNCSMSWRLHDRRGHLYCRHDLESSKQLYLSSKLGKVLNKPIRHWRGLKYVK